MAGPQQEATSGFEDFYARHSKQPISWLPSVLVEVPGEEVITFPPTSSESQEPTLPTRRKLRAYGRSAAYGAATVDVPRLTEPPKS